MTTQFQQVVSPIKPELLQLQDMGTAVRHLQLALRTLSLYTGPIDGYFGVSTEAAVRELQIHFGLDETGQFDAATWYGLTFWGESAFLGDRPVSATTSRQKLFPHSLLRPFGY